MSRAAAQPTLPQNDTPADQEKRIAQIAAARVTYEWTTSVPTLPGVPLSATVPSDDQPTLAWLLLLIEVGLKIVFNRLGLDLEGNESGLDSTHITHDVSDPRDLSGHLHQAPATPPPHAVARLRCHEIAASAAGIRAHYARQPGGGLLGRVGAGMETGIDQVEHEAHRRLLRSHASELRSIVATMDADGADGSGGGTPASLEAYMTLFHSLRVPGIAYSFQDDNAFARLRVAGPNAVLIKGIDALPANFPLTAAQYAAVVPGDTLAAALADGRLYLNDYVELSTLVPGMWDGLQKYVYQPMALFAVPPGGAALIPVAIQCGQDSSVNPIFMPSVVAAEQWGWEMAKLVVQVADGNFHELVAHLAHTHLVIEAFAVATRRNLAAVHPLWALLVPHFEGLLFINEQAAESLISAGGPIDHIFGGTITSSQLTASAARLSFDFYAKMLPDDLVTRGVADPSLLPDYPYRDDALLVWAAIKDWATQYVDIYYADDAAVTGDTELAAWAASLMAEGAVKGFTAITTRKQLALVCTMIMFTASAQHAAVNFPQKAIMTFAPAITGAGWTAAPTVQAGHDRQAWLDYMPPLPLALEQLDVLYLLGSVYYRPLGTYLSNDFPYPAWFRDPAIIGADRALPRFQAALEEVEARILARNAERVAPYRFLQPSLIPTSTNI
ncbi:MAG: lipoxygenase family protein [Sphingomonas sp.]